MPPFVLALCAAEILAMSGFASFPALLPRFQDLWGLSNTDAGWINGIYSLGYMIAVPPLAALTDRVAARRVFVASALLCALAGLGFALMADGFWSAMLFRALLGVGLAGIYVPGLKALADRVTGPGQSRAIAFYTSSFSIGTALSLYLAGALADALGWRWGLALTAIMPLAAAAIAAGAMTDAAPTARHDARMLDFRPVLRNRAAMAYIVAYGCHMWELFGIRNWLVAYLVFAATLSPMPWSAATLAAVASLMGLAAGIVGNEIALRLGRRRFIAIAMFGSAAFTALFGLTAGLPAWAIAAFAFVLMFVVSWDSAAITAGVVANADPRLKGATMAMQSSLGFFIGFASPLAFGAVLDLGGGRGDQTAWILAFATLAMGVALGPLAMRVLQPRARG